MHSNCNGGIWGGFINVVFAVGLLAVLFVGATRTHAQIANGSFELGNPYGGPPTTVNNSGVPLPWNTGSQTPDLYDNVGLTGWPLGGIPAFTGMMAGVVAYPPGNRFLGFAAGRVPGFTFQESFTQIIGGLNTAQTYAFSAAMLTDNLRLIPQSGGPYDGFGEIEVLLGNSLIGTLSPNTSPFVWQVRQFNFVPSVTSGTLMIRAAFDPLNNHSSYMGIDAVSIAPVCGTINDVRILCLDEPLAYSYTFTFTNNSGQPVQFLFFRPNLGITPLSVALPTPVPDGATSPPITVEIRGYAPGRELCLDITLANPNIEECCQILDHCITFPDCDCVQFPDCRVRLVPIGPGPVYSMTFTFQNLGTGPINELHLFPLPIGSPVTLTNPDHFFPPVLPFDPPAGPLSTLIFGATPGPLCFRVSVHLDGLECCSEVKCVTLPRGGGGFDLCDADVDDGTGSGIPDGGVTIDDLLFYLGVYSEGSLWADFDDGTGTGMPDGGVTIDDLLYYLFRFEAGC